MWSAVKIDSLSKAEYPTYSPQVRELLQRPASAQRGGEAYVVFLDFVAGFLGEGFNFLWGKSRDRMAEEG